MSGHSHAKTVKHTKDAADQKRGQVFSKLSVAITIAAKDGGDPNMNSKLRMTIDQAKKANMPSDNIEKAIKRGTGEIEGEILEEFTFEAYGPAKSALIIAGITSNKNRALGGVKIILNQHNAKMAEAGSVKWQFENKGIIIINTGEKDKETTELKVIDAGAEDISWQKEGVLEIYTTPDDLDNVKKNIEKEFKIESILLGWVAKEKIKLDEKGKQSIKKLIGALDSNDDVQEIYSNVKF